MLYCSYFFEENKSDLSFCKDDGELIHLYIEERFNKSFGYSGFPYHCFDILSKKVSNDITVISFNQYDNYLISRFLNNVIFDDYPNEYKIYKKCFQSFYTSGFNRAAVLIIKGLSDYNDNGPNVILIHKFKKETYMLKELDNKCLISKFYRDALSILGLDKNDEESFINMSLQGTAFDKHYLYYKNEDIICEYDIDKWRQNFGDLRDVLNVNNRNNFAATIIRDMRECVLEVVSYIKKLTGEDKLCLAGGLFSNLLINNDICESKIFSHVHCFPNPSEYYESIGNIYIYYEIHTNYYNNFRLVSDDIGRLYSDKNILDILNHYSIDYKIIGNDEINNILNNNIIMWFQNGSNVGKYTGINRSILYNVNSFENREKFLKIFNKEKNLLKCAIPSECFDKIFDNNSYELVQFGLRSLKVKYEYRNILSDITNCDGYIIPNIIHENNNPILYNLIMKYYINDNLPIIAYSPIFSEKSTKAETLIDCFRTLMKSDIDYIIINGKYLVNKSNLKNKHFDEYYEIDLVKE